MNHLNLVCCLLFFCACTQITLSEMPEYPNLEELCEQSEIVVNAKWNSSIDQKQRLDGKIFCSYIFDVTKCYKGSRKLSKITVFVPTGVDLNYLPHGDFILPKYQNGKDYFLFLRGYQNNTYIRISIDDIWGERPYTHREESLIEGELKEQDSPDRWMRTEDNLTYSIPDDAAEEILPLSDNQKQRYSKIVLYKKDNTVVGERGWYLNGRVAYEYAYKNGLRHGLAREWSENSTLINLYYYRKGRCHGYLLHWSGSKLEISFWLRGKNITQKQYMKECDRNLTLPKLKL